MRYFVWALRLLVFIAVLMFALKNTDPVVVKFYADYVVQDVPLIVVMLAAFVLGTLFGLLLTVPAAMRRRRERSEEHTSELQSLMRISYAVFCLKKKNQNENKRTHNNYK